MYTEAITGAITDNNKWMEAINKEKSLKENDV